MSVLSAIDIFVVLSAFLSAFKFHVYRLWSHSKLSRLERATKSFRRFSKLSIAAEISRPRKLSPMRGENEGKEDGELKQQTLNVNKHLSS